jgi:hypothetical protein
MAAKDVATAIDTATDIAVRSATPCITFSGENISVFISVLFWAAGEYRKCSKAAKFKQY